MVLAVGFGGLCAATDVGDGAGWGDGTQAIANLSWMAMIVAVIAALGFAVKAFIDHRRHATPVAR